MSIAYIRQRLNNYRSERSRQQRLFLCGELFDDADRGPCNRISLPHAEGERPIGAGGHKRCHEDDGDSNDSRR